jgi:hypothetical protein
MRIQPIPYGNDIGTHLDVVVEICTTETIFKTFYVLWNKDGKKLCDKQLEIGSHEYDYNQGYKANTIEHLVLQKLGLHKI